MRVVRLLAVALGLAPIPLAAAVASDGARARGLPQATVEARDGDLWIGGRRLTSGPAADAEPDWSPDRRNVVFVRHGTDGSSLYVVRRDGGGLRRLTTGLEAVATPAWSPDGQRIAYAASPLAGGSFDVFTIAARAGRPQLVVAGPAEQVVEGWTSDGRVSTARWSRARRSRRRAPTRPRRTQGRGSCCRTSTSGRRSG